MIFDQKTLNNFIKGLLLTPFLIFFKILEIIKITKLKNKITIIKIAKEEYNEFSKAN